MKLESMAPQTPNLSSFFAIRGTLYLVFLMRKQSLAWKAAGNGHVELVKMLLELYWGSWEGRYKRDIILWGYMTEVFLGCLFFLFLGIVFICFSLFLFD